MEGSHPVPDMVAVKGIRGILLNRRNIPIMSMPIESMLLAVNSNFLVFSVSSDDMMGQSFASLVPTVAAAESAIGPEASRKFCIGFSVVLNSDGYSLKSSGSTLRLQQGGNFSYPVPRSEHCPTSLIGFLSVHHGVVGIKVGLRRAGTLDAKGYGSRSRDQSSTGSYSSRHHIQFGANGIHFEQRSEARFGTLLREGRLASRAFRDEAFWRSQVNFGPPNPATDEKALWYGVKGSVYVVTLPAFQRCLEDGPDAAERRPGSGFPTGGLFGKPLKVDTISKFQRDRVRIGGMEILLQSL
ncbi:NADH dehydrogenase subunit 4L [Tanacetum coccineum]